MFFLGVIIGFVACYLICRKKIKDFVDSQISKSESSKLDK